MGRDKLNSERRTVLNRIASDYKHPLQSRAKARLARGRSSRIRCRVM